MDYVQQKKKNDTKGWGGYKEVEVGVGFHKIFSQPEHGMWSFTESCIISRQTIEARVSV